MVQKQRSQSCFHGATTKYGSPQSLTLGSNHLLWPVSRPSFQVTTVKPQAGASRQPSHACRDNPTRIALI
jgi:hypothetical protein